MACLSEKERLQRNVNFLESELQMNEKSPGDGSKTGISLDIQTLKDEVCNLKEEKTNLIEKLREVTKERDEFSQQKNSQEPTTTQNYIKSLEQEIEILRQPMPSSGDDNGLLQVARERDSLRQHVDELRQQLTHISSSQNTDGKRIKSLTAEKELLKDQLSVMENELTLLRQLRKDAKSRSSSRETTPPVIVKSSELDQENKLLKEKISKLEKEISILRLTNREKSPRFSDKEKGATFFDKEKSPQYSSREKSPFSDKEKSPDSILSGDNYETVKANLNFAREQNEELNRKIYTLLEENKELKLSVS